MLGFVGDWVTSAVRPHLDYARRQGITLAVAAVFAVVMTLFLVLTLFLALTYLMAPVWAALFCAVLAALVVLVMAMIAQRRARLRAAQRVVVEAEPPIEAGKAEKVALALLAARGIGALALPAALIGAAWMISRRGKKD